MGGPGGDVGLMSNHDIITTGWASSPAVFKIVAQNDLALSPRCSAPNSNPPPWLSDIPGDVVLINLTSPPGSSTSTVNGVL